MPGKKRTGSQRRASTGSRRTPARQTQAASSSSSSNSSSSDSKSATTTTPGGSSNPVSDTPLRHQREEERKDLGQLNKRLQFYILNQRERDASSDGFYREVQNEKERLERELERAKADHRAHLEQLRAQRSEKAAELAESQVQAQRSTDQVNELTEQLASEKEFAKDIEAKLRSTQEELTALQARCFHAEQSASELKSTNEVNTKIARDSEADVAKAHDELAKCQGELSRLQTRVPALEDELRHHKTHSEQEIARCKQVIDDLQKKTQKSDNQLRKEYSKRLDELFAENQKLHDQKQATILQQAQESYEEKLSGYRDKLEDSGHALALANERFANLQRDNKGLENDLQAERNRRLETERTVAALQTQIENERAASKTTLRAKVETIQQIKEAFKRKDREFDELMRMKVALGLELRALRLMVEEEEARMGYNFEQVFAPRPQGTKRKRGGNETSSSSSSAPVTSASEASEQEEEQEEEKQEIPEHVNKRPKRGEASSNSGSSEQEDEEEEEESDESDRDLTFSEVESHFVSGRDEHGRYIMLHNGSDERVALGGWKIRSKVTSDEYEFDKKAIMEPHSFMRLRWASPTHEDDLVADDGETIWLEEELFGDDKDEGYLVSPSDEVKATVDIISQTGVGATALYQPQKGCHIM